VEERSEKKARLEGKALVAVIVSREVNIRMTEEQVAAHEVDRH
jgi:hypothetical protein